MHAFKLITASLLVAAARARSSQAAFSTQGELPLQSVTSQDAFTTLSHASYPNHSVRIKRTDGFCDMTGVKTYTGYIDIEARHLFFYFFESRSNPAQDDVLMWINGGPGCSSTTGLFLELGPCRHTENGLEHNPYSWNQNTNLFFLDQPVGVGYSYADHGETVVTTEAAAIDVAAFITIFFETFREFRGRAFHMSGESYAGRYLPVFAAEVIDQNMKANIEGRTPINLQSVIIGNGYTTAALMSLSHYDMLCTNASGLPPQLPAAACVAMKAKLPRCRQWVTKNCIDTFDTISCGAALEFCWAAADAPGFNIYDISEHCPPENNFCGSELTRGVEEFLNKPDIRKKLGATKPDNFTSCSTPVGMAFNLAYDTFHNSRPYIEELLERGVRVLQYAGTYDLACSWVSNLWNVHDMQWTGRESFNEIGLQSWNFDGQVAGQVKSFGGLTFATVYAASHMVPIQKPAESLYMLQQFIKNQEL
ncbi:serine carboxypeptidase [Auriculariales sp. MPI-PUGE-AT-0066]|nr:serine carboxypeptidase [Auriculariales sp. MPI-PUGE-AT-0066]